MKKTMVEASDELHDAIKELFYQMFRVCGIVWLIKKSGWQVAEWINEREDERYEL